MQHRFAASLFCALLIFCLPLLASANEDDAYEEMLDLSNAAADAVGEGQFELGAITFRQAYDAYPDPILLNNETIAWYRADDCRSALPPAQRFLESEGLEPDDRGDVESVMVQCHLRLAKESLDDENTMLASHHLESLAGLDMDAEHEQTYRELRDTVEQLASSSEPEDSALHVESAADTPSNSLTWAQISGGIAVTGIGLALHSVALSRQSELQSLAEAGDAQRLRDRQDEWGSSQSTARWAVPTMYTIGGLAIGSGIFLLMTDRTVADLFALSPSISDDRIGVSLARRF